MFDVPLKYNNTTVEQTAFPGKHSASVCHEVEATVTGRLWLTLIHLQNQQYWNISKFP